MRDFLFAVNRPYFIDGIIYSGAEASMHAEYRVVDNGRQGQIIKDICAVPPDIQRAVFPQTLIIEAVNLCDLPALMVTSY